METAPGKGTTVAFGGGGGGGKLGGPISSNSYADNIEEELSVKFDPTSDAIEDDSGRAGGGAAGISLLMILGLGELLGGGGGGKLGRLSSSKLSSKEP